MTPSERNVAEPSVERERAIKPVLKSKSNAPAALTRSFCQETMNAADALRLAHEHIADDMVVLADTVRECEFGFYIATDTRKHQQTGRWEDLPAPGGSGLLVDRTTNEIHELGSAFQVDYWMEAYRRRLHKPITVVVTKVYDRQRAAEALNRLQMTYVIPEEAYGETWVIPQHYGLKQFRKSFDHLPVRFENQNLIFRLREIERIESGQDVVIQLVS